MKFEKLNYGKEKNKRMFLYGFIVCAIFLVLLNIIISKALYRRTESVQLANGTVNYELADIDIVAAYIRGKGEKEYKQTDDIPKEGYKLNREDSYCTNPNDPSPIKNILSFSNGNLIINLTKKGTKCYLFFEEFYPADEVLAKLNLQSQSKISSEFTGPSCDSNDDNNGCGEYNMNQNGLYESEDDDGLTYFFRGSVNNNYLQFAGKMWRIIRINGNGSIRIIYDGNGHKNGEITTDNIAILKQRWSIQNQMAYFDNMYVGLTWTENQVRGYEVKSNVYNRLMDWYSTNLKDYEKHIDRNSGFCNDRQPSSSKTVIDNKNGIGTEQTYYGAYVRLADLEDEVGTTMYTPSFKCSNETNHYADDLYTVEGAKKSNKTNGNEKLLYPIGLITADEVSFAGGFFGSNNYRYYLYNGQHYWTISPFWMTGSAAIFQIRDNGELNRNNTYAEFGIRPVVNLKADTIFEFTDDETRGTIGNPYVVVD